MAEYIETNGGTSIDTDNIVYKDNDGILEETAKTWRYVPYSEIKEESNTIPDSTYGLLDDTDTTTKERAEYAYTVTMQGYQREEASVCGLVTKQIPLSNCRSLTLETEMEIPDGASIEFTILDGSNEIPILPKDIKKVVHERIFNGQDTRFQEDTSQSYTFYKNGTEIFSIKDEDLSDSSVVYTVSYVPMNAWKIVPSSTSIRLRIIMYPDLNGNMPKITSVTLYKQGSELAWTY